MNQLNLTLLFTFFKQEIRISNNLVRLLHDLIDIRCFTEEFGIAFLIIFHSFLLKELFAHICPCIQFLSSELNIDKVRFLKDFVHFVHLLTLQLVNMPSQIIKEVINGRPDVIAQVKLLTVGNMRPILCNLI